LGFFEEQDRARRATARLFVLYGIAVALIVALVNLVTVPVYHFWFDARVTWVTYATVSATTLGLIALGTLEIMARLHVGTGELAQILAGKRVPRGSGIDAERRLINIVDEMAIASGLAAPPVLVLNREKGINAFVIGWSPSQAVVVVTQGALEQLSRDELQAVIAHEFSHILNGDIRLNTRAACILQGIIFLAAIGKFMMRYYSGYGTEEGRRFFHLPLAVIGVGVFSIGAVGVPFARIIQAAISREREFLADASAVQFTRNADALCGALARIRAYGEGARIANWHADAMAHMFFSTATHPPIETRMRRANPHVSPHFYFEKASKPRVVEKPVSPGQGAAGAAAPRTAEPPKTIVPKKVTAVAMLIATMGEANAESLDHAKGLIAYLPGDVRDAIADRSGAQATLLGCLLAEELTVRGAQLRALEARGEAPLARKAEVLGPVIASVDRAYRLPIVALALPVLKDLDETGRERFLGHVRAVIEADARVTLSEFVLSTILDAHLGPAARRAGRVTHKSREEVSVECALVLSLLAHAGGAGAPAAFEKGRQALVLPSIALAPLEGLKLGEVTKALAELRGLAPAEKALLVAGCAEVTTADGNVKLAEHELLRAVCSALDCPMPASFAALDARLLRR
jgi:Zn-dependent protease with chaperone function